MREVWCWIEGYEILYQVSNLGRVCSYNGKMKTQSGTLGPKSRYKYVTLYKNNVGTKLQVHRLVAKHFIPNPHNYPNVLHKKNDRANNKVTNLKWGTQKDNIGDAIREGTYRKPPIYVGTQQWNAKLNEEKVREIRKIKALGERVSQEELAARFGISRGTLRFVLSGKSWRHVQ